ncbi:hypothetical protein [Clostridium rectalis]|uniref:hypothetical protein n=1 Tax=Clostridium rectalis TaxID=2040295 RepID=UPI000F640DD9|nr:hypothetical protein [Clostridium rectalis]
MKNIIDSLLHQLKCRVTVTEYTYIHGSGMANVAMFSIPKCTKVIYYSDINEMKQALKGFKNNENIMIDDIQYVKNNKSIFN